MNTAALLDLATEPGINGSRGCLSERRLLTAVLRQALDDLRDYQLRRDPNARRIHDAASGWIFSGANTEEEDHLSFERTCNLLGIEPSYLRGLIRRQIASTGLTGTRRPSARKSTPGLSTDAALCSESIDPHV